jgi:hypothetical protein
VSGVGDDVEAEAKVASVAFRLCSYILARRLPM